MRIRLLASLTVSLSISFAADRVTLTGKVTDTQGKPLEDATVMIYHAGVKKGDIQIQTGHTLRGKVTLSDGAAIADGMRVTINSTRAFDSQTVIIGHAGSFEFAGLAPGEYEIFTSVRGYQLSGGQNTVAKTIDRDIDNVVIALEPAPQH